MWGTSNGKVSDKIFFSDKDSDKEMSNYDNGWDYGMVKLEMGNIHDINANGELTLGKYNG